MSAAPDIRPFVLRDLAAVARFCEAARVLDPAVEPFAQRLSLIARGPRARLSLWRVAATADGAVYGISFAALREAAGRPVYDFYVAVHPSVRRTGLGRALSQPALAEEGTLRARVRDGASAGIAFLRSLGFSEAGAQLTLQWAGEATRRAEAAPARVRSAGPADEEALRMLSNDAWAGAPEAFASRADEIAQLFGSEGRLVLLAETEAGPAGYLSAVPLGRTLGIEEVAVLPGLRRRGIARALVLRALLGAEGAVLSVAESNVPARALYRALGFRQTGRRVVMERSAP